MCPAGHEGTAQTGAHACGFGAACQGPRGLQGAFIGCPACSWYLCPGCASEACPHGYAALIKRAMDKLLRDAHALLIAPLAEALAGEEHLLIVPDRDLYALPFAALRDAEGTHLIERHSVRVAPSIGTLVELEKRRAANVEGKPRSLVVGGVDFDGWTVGDDGTTHLPELPGSSEEAYAVGEVLRGACLLYTSPSPRD